MTQTITRAHILHDLQSSLAIAPGHRIAVHSSMKSLGQVDGGPIALIEALIEAIGGPERGTLLMPCFNQPLDVVDVRNTPCRLGLVPETFRTYPGVHLSPNQTHRVAVYGKDAAAIAACHENSTALGVGSPFHELAKRGGSIIHIGCDFRSSSLIHVAEHLYPLPYHAANVPYPGYDKNITLVLPDGTRQIRAPRELPGDSAGFTALQKEMERYNLILHGKVAAAPSMKIRGLDMLAMAIDLLAKNPVSLLCSNPKCPVCPPKRKIAEARAPSNPV